MNKKAIVGLICGLMSGSITATSFAAACPLMIGNGRIELSESYDVEDSNKNVSVTVLNPGKQFDDTAWESGDSSGIAFLGLEKTNGEGNCLLNFIVKKNGVYTVISHIDGDTNNNISYFENINKDDFVNSLLQIKSCNSENEIVSLLGDSEKRYSLGLSEKYFDSSIANIAKIINNSKDLLDENNPKDTISKLKRIMIYSAIKSGALSALSEDETEYLILSSRASNWFENKNLGNVFNRIKKSNEDTISGIDDVVVESILLERIFLPNGNSDVVNIVKEYGSAMKITNNNISISDAAKVAGKNFNNYQELKTALEEKDTNNEASNEKTVSRGVSGGVSSGGRNTYPSTSISQTTETCRFDDMIGYDWVANEVENLALRGIISGKGDNKFEPASPVKREEFVKMVVLLLNLNVVPDEFKFQDVSKDSWAYEYIRRGLGSGIVKGVSENCFGIGQSITRQDAMVILYNALNYSEKISDVGLDNVEFKDSDKISDYAKKAVNTFGGLGIVNGYNGNVSPKSTITRAEAAKLIYNVMSKYSL